MKFNRDIFLTAPLWANWATLDRWGHIWIWEFEPKLSECGEYWKTINPATFYIRIGRVADDEPKRIKKP